MQYPLLQKLITESKSQLPLGVVYPLSLPALETVFELIKKEICKPILIGPQKLITELAKGENFSLDGIEIIDTPDDPITATKTAVAMVKLGKLAALMLSLIHI